MLRLHPGLRLVAVGGLIPRARAAADRSGKRRLAGHRPTQESAGSRSSLREGAVVIDAKTHHQRP